MTSIRKLLAAPMLAGAALLTAATGLSIAYAAQDATAVTPPADAQGPGGPRGHWHHRGGERLFSKLGLTTEQQASVKAIWTAAKPQMKTMHDSMLANRMKLMTTKPDDPNYANVVAEVAQSNATLASQRTSQAAELKAQMYAVLTPAQKTQLTTLEAQLAANPHHGRGPVPAGAPVPAT